MTKSIKLIFPEGDCRGHRSLNPNTIHNILLFSGIENSRAYIEMQKAPTREVIELGLIKCLSQII